MSQLNNPYNIRRAMMISRFSSIFTYIVVGIMAFACLAPFLFVFNMSISSPENVLARNVFLFPRGFTLAAYERVINTTMIWRSYANTIFYVSSATILNCVFSVMGGYALSKNELPGRRLFSFLLLIPMFFTGGMIPTYVLIVKLGIYNSPLAIILPASVAVWHVILTRTFIKTIPKSICESAYIDGAGDIAILFRIIVPLSKPIIAVIGLYTAVGVWNSWLPALLYLPDRELQPIQLFLARLLVLETTILNREGAIQDMRQSMNFVSMMLQLKYAAVIFCSLPIICAYPFLQRYFIKGVLLGSLKE